MKAELTAFDASRYLVSQEMVAEYLTAAAEEDHPELLVKALADVVKARGMALVAKDADLGRESLYKALAPGAHQRFETIHAVLRALGVHLSVRPANIVAEAQGATAEAVAGRVRAKPIKATGDGKSVARAAGRPRRTWPRKSQRLCGRLRSDARSSASLGARGREFSR